jgi:hypothetical protein
VKIRSADAEEDAHGVADLGLQRMQLRQRADRAVEDEIFRVLVQKLFDAELGAAVLPVRHIGVDLALHDIELMIGRRQAFLRFDQNESVHAVGDVLGHHRRGAVINIEPGHQRFPGHGFLLAGIDLQRGGAAARTGRGVEIDRVNHRAVGGVLQMDVDGVADTHADERSGHLAVERPVTEGRALGQPPFDFDADEIDPHGLRFALADRRWQVGRFA